jgi:hypothetical protein
MQIGLVLRRAETLVTDLIVFFGRDTVLCPDELQRREVLLRQVIVPTGALEIVQQ